MDKNKWIDKEIVNLMGYRKEFIQALDGSMGERILAINDFDKQEKRLRQSLSEAWDKGRNDMHNEIWNSKTSETLERIEI